MCREPQAAFQTVADDLQFLRTPIAIGAAVRAVQRFTIGPDNQALSTTLRTRQPAVSSDSKLGNLSDVSTREMMHQRITFNTSRTTTRTRRTKARQSVTLGTQPNAVEQHIRSARLFLSVRSFALCYRRHKFQSRGIEARCSQTMRQVVRQQPFGSNSVMVLRCDWRYDRSRSRVLWRCLNRYRNE
jgi:hypothetical protein